MSPWVPSQSLAVWGDTLDRQGLRMRSLSGPHFGHPISQQRPRVPSASHQELCQTTQAHHQDTGPFLLWISLSPWHQHETGPGQAVHSDPQASSIQDSAQEPGCLWGLASVSLCHCPLPPRCPTTPDLRHLAMGGELASQCLLSCWSLSESKLFLSFDPFLKFVIGGLASAGYRQKSLNMGLL